MTYSFSNATTADATQVNQNFTDLINGLSDGTKNISVSAITAAGSTNLQGAITLGASSSNDITVNGSLASTVAVKTTFSYDLGGSTIGLRSIYLGDSGSAARTTRIIGAAVASSWTLTTPIAVPGGASYVLESTTGGVTSWSSRTDLAVVSKTTTYTATRADDVILCSGSAFTVTLPAASGSMKRFIIKKTDSTIANIITIARAGSDVIQDSSSTVTSTTLNTDGESIEIVSDGSATWHVLRRDYSRAMVSFSMTITATSVNPTKGTVTETAYYRRDGDGLYIQYSLIQTVAGTAGTGTYLFAIPNSATWTIDTTKLPVSTNCNNTNVGMALLGASSDSTDSAGVVNAYDSTHLSLAYISSGGSGTAVAVKNATFDLSNGTIKYIWFARIPISGWN